MFGFEERIRRVLKDMIESQGGELVMHLRGKDLVVENRFDLCFTWKLTLKDVSGLPEKVTDGWLLWCSDIESDGDGYVLVGDVEGPELEDCMDVRLRFSGVDVELASLRADAVDAHSDPWCGLSALANGIIRKSEVAPQLMNERERALLPLLREIAMLTGWCGADKLEFPLLRERMEPELLPLLERVEQSGPEWKKLWKVSNRLQRQLDRSKYAHIWRGIYEEYAASQAEYPLKSCVSEEVRQRIGEKLHGLGYSGSYPDFVRPGEIRGLRRGKFRDQIWFVFHERNTAFHIHCREYASWDGSGQIEFICGTELLRRGETAGDILSCMFRAGGRRLIRSGSSVLCDDLGELDRKLGIAVKRAELRGLNREELKVEGTPAVLPLLLIGSCIFAALAIGFFMVVCSLVTGLLFGWAEIPAMLLEMPWAGLFLFAWALIGITFAFS